MFVSITFAKRPAQATIYFSTGLPLIPFSVSGSIGRPSSVVGLMCSCAHVSYESPISRYKRCINGREISLSVELCLIADQGEPSSVRAAANSKNGQQWNVCTWFQLEKRWRFTIWWSPVRTSFLQQGKLGRGTVSFTPSPEHIYATNASHTAEVPPRRTQHHIDSGEGDCSTLVTVKSFMTWTWSHMV